MLGQLWVQANQLTDLCLKNRVVQGSLEDVTALRYMDWDDPQTFLGTGITGSGGRCMETDFQAREEAEGLLQAGDRNRAEKGVWIHQVEWTRMS